MIQAVDAWYVRLPSGRVLRAKGKLVRRYLKAGKLPKGTHVRRSPDEEWLALEWTQEFADALKAMAKAKSETPLRSLPPAPPKAQRPGSVAAHLDPVRLPTIGISGIAQELLAALDNTFTRSKMLVAGAACLAGGVVVALLQNGARAFAEEGSTWWWLAGAILVALLGFGACALITRMTYIEVSRLRPSRWHEARAGIAAQTLRLALAVVLVAGTMLLTVALLRWFPRWLLETEAMNWSPATRENLAGMTAAVALVFEVALWPIVAFTLLLAPLLAVEECSLAGALVAWWRLIHRHSSRAFAYQALAIAVGAVISLPFVLPVYAVWLGTPAEGPLVAPVQSALTLLISVAAAPFCAYLFVANVFIYLNLRYEYSLRR